MHEQMMIEAVEQCDSFQLWCRSYFVNKTCHLYVCEGGHSGHLDVHPHWITALAWPQNKGLIEGCLGLTVDSLLIGRVDGSVAVIEVFDSSTFCRKELQHCSRAGGKSTDTLTFFYWLQFVLEYVGSSICLWICRM